jgi:agmatinase
MSQQSALEYLSHGQAPFFRLRRADRHELPPGARAAFLGVPTDAGTTYQPGARFAPWHVRRVSALVQGWSAAHGLDAFAATGAVDCGNVAFPPFDRELARAAIEGAASALFAQGAAPFVVGGDHSVTLPVLRAAAAVLGPLAVVHVDAHLDTSGPEVWGDAWHHGTPMRHALAEGLVAPGQLHQVGMRGPWGSAEERDLSAAHGGSLRDADEVADRGVLAIAAELRRAVGDRPVYLSFDVDAVDPAFAPGTGTPVPGGLSAREALRLVRALAGVRLVGMDVVEVCPPLDHADLTSHLAAHLLFEGLAVAAAAGASRRP